MKTLANMFAFTLGAAAGVSAYMGLESLGKNQYTVKKRVNNAIDNVANSIK